MEVTFAKDHLVLSYVFCVAGAIAESLFGQILRSLYGSLLAHRKDTNDKVPSRELDDDSQLSVSSIEIPLFKEHRLNIIIKALD